MTIAITPSVTALWESYRTVAQISLALEPLTPTDNLDGIFQPIDTVGLAGHHMLPSILSIPARTMPEAMMQICALAGILACESCSTGPWDENDIMLWFSALASIVRALGEAEALPDIDLSEILGRRVVDDIAKRLAEMAAA